MSFKILIVEDEVVIALDLQKRLVALGYKPFEIVSNGKDAIRVAKETYPDLILMDILLAGDLDGIETASLINKDMDIPVIYVTAYSDQNILDRAKQTNSYGYVNKPYNDRELVSTIEIAMARANMQKFLKSQERRFRSIFESAGDQFMVINSNGRILEANSETKRELSYTTDELKVLSLDHLCNFKKSYLHTILKKVLHSKTPLTLQSKMKRKDESQFPCEIKISVFSEEMGKPLFLAVARNISEREDARKDHESLLLQLSHSGKLATLGTLSASYIHELKNPLTSILGFTELLLENQTLSPDVREKVSIIQKASQKMNETVKHLNAYSRTESKVEMKDLDLNKAVSSALEMMKTQIHNIALTVDYAPNLSPIFGSMSQLEGVMQNLLVNSVDSFQDHGLYEGSISIKTSLKNERVVLEYEDNAGGIAKKILPKVFEPFFTTKEPGRGTGLGLSIIRNIVELHKGLIQVRVKEGKGTSFEISFPVSADYAGAPFDRNKMLTCNVERTGKPHILLIDDDPQFTSVLESVLSDKFDVVTFNDPEKALAQIKKTDVDLIVTDLDMPKITGQEIIRFTNSLDKHIPIIVVTGINYNNFENLKNVEAVVEKPISEYDKLITFILENLD